MHEVAVIVQCAVCFRSKADMKWPLNRKLRVLWTKIRIGVRNWLDIEEQSLTNEQITGRQLRESTHISRMYS